MKVLLWSALTLKTVLAVPLSSQDIPSLTKRDASPIPPNIPDCTPPFRPPLIQQGLQTTMET